MAQFENKSFTVQMRSSGADSDDLAKRWRETFGHAGPAKTGDPVAQRDETIGYMSPLSVSRVQLYQLLSQEAQIGGAVERDRLHTALDIIWYRLSAEEKDAIQR